MLLEITKLKLDSFCACWKKPEGVAEAGRQHLVIPAAFEKHAVTPCLYTQRQIAEGLSRTALITLLAVGTAPRHARYLLLDLLKIPDQHAPDANKAMLQGSEKR